MIVQQYLHDVAAWNALPVEEQEKIIGRAKLSDIELSDDVKPSYAHNALTVITGDDGEEVQIVRDNMPFGSVGRRVLRHLLHRLRPLACHDRADARPTCSSAPRRGTTTGCWTSARR